MGISGFRNWRSSWQVVVASPRRQQKAKMLTTLRVSSLCEDSPTCSSFLFLISRSELHPQEASKLNPPQFLHICCCCPCSSSCVAPVSHSPVGSVFCVCILHFSFASFEANKLQLLTRVFHRSTLFVLSACVSPAKAASFEL